MILHLSSCLTEPGPFPGTYEIHSLMPGQSTRMSHQGMQSGIVWVAVKLTGSVASQVSRRFNSIIPPSSNVPPSPRVPASPSISKRLMGLSLRVKPGTDATQPGECTSTCLRCIMQASAVHYSGVAPGIYTDEYSAASQHSSFHTRAYMAAHVLTALACQQDTRCAHQSGQ